LTLPTTIFGVCALVAGIMSLWLPETLNVKLPQTIEEAEAAPEKYGVPGCCRLRNKSRAVSLTDEDDRL